MTESTKVLYDVSQAIKELNKLNAKVDQAGDKANDSFEKGSKGASLFDKALGKIPGTAGNVVRGLTGMSGGMAALAAGAGIAVGAVASVVAQFIDLDDILRDSLKSIEAFNKATDTIQNTRESVSAIGDAAINRDIRLAQRAVKLEQAENARAQNAVEQARDTARQRLDIVRDELRRREGLLDAAVSREEDLRARLDRRTAGDVGSQFAGFDADLQAAKLNQEARLAAQRGELDLAEELEAKAQDVAREANNQAFALADQANTRSSITRAIGDELAEAEKATNEARNQVEEAQRVATALDSIIDKENKRLTVLRQQSRELGAQQKLLRVEAREARETQQADTAARTAENSARDFVNNINNGGKSFAETVVDAGSELRKFLTDNADRQAAIGITQDAAGGAAQLEQFLKRVASGTARVGDVDAAAPALQKLTDAVAQLQGIEGIDTLTGDQTRTLRRLEDLVQSGTDAFNSIADLRDVRTDEQFIREGTQGPSEDTMRSLKDSILKLNDTLSAPSQGAAAAPASNAQSQGAPAPVTSTASNVTVNANVRGGIIDEEVTRKITEIIRRELRKQTTQGVA